MCVHSLVLSLNKMSYSHRELESMMDYHYPHTHEMQYAESYIQPFNDISSTKYHYNSKDVYIRYATPLNEVQSLKHSAYSASNIAYHTEFSYLNHAQEAIEQWVQTLGTEVTHLQEFKTFKVTLRDTYTEHELKTYLLNKLHCTRTGKVVLEHMHSDAMSITPSPIDPNAAQITFIDPYTTNEWYSFQSGYGRRIR